MSGAVPDSGASRDRFDLVFWGPGRAATSPPCGPRSWA